MERGLYARVHSGLADDIGWVPPLRDLPTPFCWCDLEQQFPRSVVKLEFHPPPAAATSLLAGLLHCKLLFES